VQVNVRSVIYDIINQAEIFLPAVDKNHGYFAQLKKLFEFRWSIYLSQIDRFYLDFRIWKFIL